MTSSLETLPPAQTPAHIYTAWFISGVFNKSTKQKIHSLDLPLAIYDVVTPYRATQHSNLI